MTAWHPIPGETPIDPSGLMVDNVTNRMELSIVEAENIRKVFVKYLAGKPNRRIASFDFTWCLKLHKEMYGDVWQWAGVIRSRDGLNIGIPFYCIRDQLQGLLNDLMSWEDYGMDLLEQAARLHHRTVKIHPFENGNGRWARMLANIWLKLHGHVITSWPDNIIGDRSDIRAEYIATMIEADNGDYKPLTELLRRYTTIA